MKRTIATTLAALALGLGACSSGAEDPAETGQAPTTTTAPPVEVTPTVVCVDEQRQAVYFGYANGGDRVVDIPVGEANAVTRADGSAATDQQPTTFAPGEQGPVFWVALDDDGGAPTWSLTGEDGAARTATPDDSSPTCSLGPDVDDDREATVVATVDADGSSATITFSVEGLDTESRCPSGAGWTPEAADVTVTAEGMNVTPVAGDDPLAAQVEVDDLAAEPFGGPGTPGFASVDVYVDVVDRCTDEAGATAEAWGASATLRDLSQLGTRICFGVVGDGYDEVGCEEGPQLAPTGGIRSR